MLFNGKESALQKEWLRSSEVRKFLKISPGTLQNLRIAGKLNPSKINGSYFYLSTEVTGLVESGISKRKEASGERTKKSRELDLSFVKRRPDKCSAYWSFYSNCPVMEQQWVCQPHICQQKKTHGTFPLGKYCHLPQMYQGTYGLWIYRLPALLSP